MTAPDETTAPEAGERYGVFNGHLVEYTDKCTCGAGGPYGHEPGCGMEPLGKIEDLLATRAPAPTPRDACICDGAKYDPDQRHPFLVNPGCPRHDPKPSAVTTWRDDDPTTLLLNELDGMSSTGAITYDVYSRLHEAVSQLQDQAPVEEPLKDAAADTLALEAIEVLRDHWFASPATSVEEDLGNAAAAIAAWARRLTQPAAAGPCDRGVCSGAKGHDGSCAEASGWAHDPSPGGDEREELYGLLVDHFAGVDRDGDYDGTCSCGWSEPEGWTFHAGPSTWREHVADALIADGYRKQVAPAATDLEQAFTARCEQFARPADQIPVEHSNRLLTVLDARVAWAFATHSQGRHAITETDDATSREDMFVEGGAE